MKDTKEASKTDRKCVEDTDESKKSIETKRTSKIFLFISQVTTSHPLHSALQLPCNLALRLGCFKLSFLKAKNFLEILEVGEGEADGFDVGWKKGQNRGSEWF